MSRLFVGLCLATWLILLTFVQPAVASTAVLPIKLDYPLLRSFFVQQAFSEPEETAVIIDEHDGCQSLQLQHPEIFPENGALRLKADVALRMGLPLLDSCRMPIGLAGQIDVLLKVQLDVANWTLRFQTEDLRFTTLDGKSSVLSAQVLELVRERLFGHLDQVAVNLSTPVQELRDMLPLFFEPEAQTRIVKWLQGIRPGRVEARSEFYSVELLMEVETDQTAGGPPPPARELSADEMERFVSNWEGLDAFLVDQIGRLGQFGLDDQERADIMQTLLATRYQFVAALAADRSDSGGQDMVRAQFLAAWERLTPLFRKYLARDPAVAPWSFLVYLSAGDVLAALDTLGPSMGIEISRDGLLRLARLLAEDGGGVPLDYSFEVDPALRKMLGFGPPLEVPGEVFPGEEVDVENLIGVEDRAQKKVSWLRLATWFDLSPSLAFAAELPLADMQALKPWLVDLSNFDAYQQRVRALLQAEAKQVVDSGRLSADRHDLFAKILQATAWQESCFRQFQVKNGKMTYLRSWNNTSVGLMQINERVWRGLYRIDALRWDPKYNIQAGSEILRMYLSDYALKKAKGGLVTDDDLARATYALYNSGPQNFSSFLARHAGRNYGQSDALFWDKFVWVKADAFDRLKTCLFGE